MYKVEFIIAHANEFLTAGVQHRMDCSFKSECFGFKFGVTVPKVSTLVENHYCVVSSDLKINFLPLKNCHQLALHFLINFIFVNFASRLRLA